MKNDDAPSISLIFSAPNETHQTRNLRNSYQMDAIHTQLGLSGVNSDKALNHISAVNKWHIKQKCQNLAFMNRLIPG